MVSFFSGRKRIAQLPLPLSASLPFMQLSHSYFLQFLQGKLLPTTAQVSKLSFLVLMGHFDKY